MNTYSAIDDDTQDQGVRDYTRVAKAIAFLETHAKDHPRLDDLAAHLGLSAGHMQKLFHRWAGITPKQFVALITHGRARSLLFQKTSVLDAALEAGLSGPSRLHDLCLSVEAMTPGEIGRGGAGLVLSYGFYGSPFGVALLVASGRGLSGLAFGDVGEDEALLSDMRSRWPASSFVHAPEVTYAYARKIFQRRRGDIKLVLQGTPFQLSVWRALMAVPAGHTTTYSDIAAKVCSTKAVRAVGSAVGRNPISYLIPCHRVLRKTGALGGYHWGETRKRALLAFEAVHKS